MLASGVSGVKIVINLFNSAVWLSSSNEAAPFGCGFCSKLPKSFKMAVSLWLSLGNRNRTFVGNHVSVSVVLVPLVSLL